MWNTPILPQTRTFSSQNTLNTFTNTQTATTQNHSILTPTTAKEINAQVLQLINSATNMTNALLAY